MLWTKTAHQCTIFRLLGALLMKIHPILPAIFETTRSGFFQISHRCSVPWEKTPLYFLAQTSYILDKNSPSEWNFSTFEWLGENSRNSSCHIWNCKSVFLLNFASLFNAMGHKSSVLFLLKFYLIFTKGAHHSAKFQTSDCWGEISPNLYSESV